MMKAFTLRFSCPERNTVFIGGDTTAITVDVTRGLSLSLHYDFRDEPLTVRADAKAKDSITLSVSPAHIVLYVNDAVADEEWPCGALPTEHLRCEGMAFTLYEGETAFTLPQRKHLTADALRLPGVNIGDCMPYAKEGGDGRYHLYWLYDRHHHGSKWGLGAHQWAHASTADLVHWDEHPMAVAITEPYEGSICTGSTITHESISYCWYTVRMADGSPAQVTCAVSHDGEHYVKSGKYFTLPARYFGASARDPKVIWADGKFHMFLTTTDLWEDKGCLAHLVSDHADMREFTDLGPIFHWEKGLEPECPDYFEMNGYYYLIYSGRYVYAKQPFGKDGWIKPEDDIVHCGTVPKTAVCPWNGMRVAAGFLSEGGYAGSLVLKRVENKENGELVFSKL